MVFARGIPRHRNHGVEAGRRDLDERIRRALDSGEPVVIAGLSEGTLVINRELAHLATDPDAPPAGSLSFVVFSSPELGLASTYWPDGLTAADQLHGAESARQSIRCQRRISPVRVLG
ncbi:MAG: PE-PPE domain-containing protein [Mycobacterium sp.]